MPYLILQRKQGVPPTPPDYWYDVTPGHWSITGAFATTQGLLFASPFSLRSLVGVSSGKYYVELTTVGDGPGRYTFGVSTSTAGTEPIATPTGHWLYSESQARYTREGTYIDTITDLVSYTPTVYGLAVDMDAKTIRFYGPSGLIVGTNNIISTFPLTGGPTNPSTVYINVSSEGSNAWGSVTANFGQSAFAYTVPAGYNPGWPTYF